MNFRSGANPGRFRAFSGCFRFGLLIAVISHEAAYQGAQMLLMILTGLLVGAIAKVLVAERDPGGAVITIVLGIAGSIGAVSIGQTLGWYVQGETAAFVSSILGAILVLSIYRTIASWGDHSQDARSKMLPSR
jgi:uncharacterized membrane protein YeaQ/YmgE (transglycosylase-associated protein family)